MEEEDCVTSFHVFRRFVFEIIVSRKDCLKDKQSIHFARYTKFPSQIKPDEGTLIFWKTFFYHLVPFATELFSRVQPLTYTEECIKRKFFKVINISRRKAIEKIIEYFPYIDLCKNFSLRSYQYQSRDQLYFSRAIAFLKIFQRVFLSLGWLLENAVSNMQQTSSEVHFFLAIIFSFSSFSWLHFKSIICTYVSHIKSLQG